MTRKTRPAEDTDGAGQPTKDRPLDPFRVPKTDAARAVVATVLERLRSLEDRKRQRKASDEDRFVAAVTALVSDLSHRYLTVPDGWLAVSQGRDQLGVLRRYAAPTDTTILPAIIKRLSQRGVDILRARRGHRAYRDHRAAFMAETAGPTIVPDVPARLTVLQVGPRLATLIREKALTMNDLGREDTGELIVLRREKKGDDERGKAIAYEDDATTEKYRHEMQAINEWIGEADLQLLLPDGTHGTVRQAGDLTIDTDNRRLYRGFTRKSFTSGGRLNGGFWQAMQPWMRHGWLRIDGQPVVTADFATMSARIVYALAGIRPAWDDAYAFPGFEGHRAGTKKVFNAALFATKRFARFPGDAEDDFPPGTAIRDVVDAMLDLHAPIAPSLFKGKGHEVQFIESTILVDVLLALKEKDIVALPVHDALIIPESDAEDAKDVMLEKFRKHTGADGLVRIDREGRCWEG